MEEQLATSLGKCLKSEREKKQITLEQIASATKINLKLLNALEEDDYDPLPAKPFIRGFIKSYLKFLNLDATDVLLKFDSFLDEKESKKLKYPIGTPHIFVGAGKQTDNNKTTLSIVMGGFLLVAAIVFVVLKPSLKHKHIHSKEKISNQEEVTTVIPVPTISPIPPPIPEQTKPTIPEISKTQLKSLLSQPEKEVKYQLTIRATQDSWIQYQADDHTKQELTLKKDQIAHIKAQDRIRFSTGNPNGISISSDNKHFYPYQNGFGLLTIPRQAEQPSLKK